MKKLFTLLVLTSGFFYSQEKAVTANGKIVSLNSDHTWTAESGQVYKLNSEFFTEANGNTTAGLYNPEKTKLSVKSGDDQNVLVDFKFNSSTEKFKEITLKKLQDMIDLSRNSVMLKLKNKFSFVPRKIDIFYSDEFKAWIVMWSYTSKNSYGGEVEGLQSNKYDNDLKEVDISDKIDDLKKQYLKDKKRDRKNK